MLGEARSDHAIGVGLTEAGPKCSTSSPAGGGEGLGSRRRSDPYYRKLWLGDWRTVLMTNFSAASESVEMVVVTAPGADRLPWDRSKCSHGDGVKCSGKHGCVPEAGPLAEWNGTAPGRWTALHRAAAAATRRKHGSFKLVSRAWEPQSRGALHQNAIVRTGTAREMASAATYRRQLARLAPKYGFGFVDRKRRVVTALHAARYLSKYLTEGGKQTGIGDLAARGDCPKVIARVDRELTRQTRVTMRWCRENRIHYAMSRNLKCEPHEAAVVRERVLAYAKHRRQAKDDWRKAWAASSGLPSLEEVMAELDPDSTSDQRWQRWQALAAERAILSAFRTDNCQGDPVVID